MKNQSSEQLTYSFVMRWVIAHMRAIRFAYQEFISAPFSNVMTVCVISIAIALPLGFFIVLKNVQRVGNAWDSKAPTISLYLKTNATSAQTKLFLQRLKQNSRIAKVTYISPAAGLKMFEHNTPFNHIAASFKHNPIPGVVSILPSVTTKDPLALHALYGSLQALPLVHAAQLDMNWVTRLHDIVMIGKTLTNGLFILLGFGVILIISHALRLSLSHHMNEVQVLRLIGASNAYIRRPLHYRGVLYGLLGGVIAWVLIAIFFGLLQAPVSSLAQTYHALFQLQTMTFAQGLMLVGVSALLGLLSAWLITTQFLRQPEQIGKTY